MGVKVNIPVLLGHLTDGVSEVSAPGGTVGEVLRNVARKFPRLGGVLFPQNGHLDEFINIFLNERALTAEDDPLAKPVGDGDEISIVIPLAGG